MRRLLAIAVALALVVSGVAGTTVASLGENDGTVEKRIPGLVGKDRNVRSAANETNENATIPPGAKLSGIVGAQQAEIEGEVTTRAFAIAFTEAVGNGSKAAVIAERIDRLHERLRELRERKMELRRAFRNGSIERGTFAARMAELAAEISTVKRLANLTAAAARGLPVRVLERRGINVSAIRTLERRAANLTGPEVAAIARSIAGRGAGVGIGGGVPGTPPVTIGPPKDVPATNRTGTPGADPGPDGTGPPEGVGKNGTTPSGPAGENGSGPPVDVGGTPRQSPGDSGRARSNGTDARPADGEAATRSNASGAGDTSGGGSIASDDAADSHPAADSERSNGTTGETPTRSKSESGAAHSPRR